MMIPMKRADLVTVIPTRGRPGAVPELLDAFQETCTGTTDLILAVDGDDPQREAYSQTVRDKIYSPGRIAQPCGTAWDRVGVMVVDGSMNMVDALNRTVGYLLDRYRIIGHLTPDVIVFMGDDHRPRTRGWDETFLATLRKTPGFAYGDDLVHGRALPTHVAMSTSVIQALGHMAPDVLTHLYVDDYWRMLGEAAGCLYYLPDVIVEHLHPVVGKASWDDGYRRVNSPEMYAKDAQAITEYWNAFGDRDVNRVLACLAAQQT